VVVVQEHKFFAWTAGTGAKKCGGVKLTVHRWSLGCRNKQSRQAKGTGAGALVKLFWAEKRKKGGP